MCRRHWLTEVPESDDELGYPVLPSLPPRLMWAIPVSMSELGASIEAYSDTIPQANTLRLCHRFSNHALSRIPQEIIEQIVNEIRRSAYGKIAPGWHRDFLCFQNRCSHESHFHDKDFDFSKFLSTVPKHCLPPGYRPGITEFTDAEKTELFLHSGVDDQSFFIDNNGFEFHFDAQYRYISRTCLCCEHEESKGFGRFNKLLRSHFGLEAVIMHEMVEESLNDYLFTLFFWFHMHDGPESRVGYTRCYLTLASDTSEHNEGGSPSLEAHDQFECRDYDKAFHQVIDPSLLTLSESQRLRFRKAMRTLDISPHYHLSELEPHVQHPIKDETLAELCTCFRSDCEASPDIRSWDKAYCVQEFLDSKSKELAKDSWPKLTMVAASSAVVPFWMLAM